jgi:DNA-binding PucR family transcriptional regulator
LTEARKAAAAESRGRNDTVHNRRQVRGDDQYSTDLVRTLEAYLDTNCNMNTTSAWA